MWRILTTLIVAVTFFVSPGWAQMQQQDQQQSGQKMQQRAMKKQVKQVTGQVTKMKRVNIKGTDTQHQVVMLRTQQGGRVIADLGPAQNVSNLNIRQGTQLSVRGKVGRVSDRPVLFASQVRTDGRTVQISRPESRQQLAQTRGMPSGKSRQITGQVMKQKEVNIAGTDMSHKVVLLQTQKGQQVAVDLGPTDNLQNIDLQRGEQITVTGKPAKVSQKFVILAQQLKADGQTINIRRPQTQQQMQQQRGMQRGSMQQQSSGASGY